MGFFFSLMIESPPCLANSPLEIIHSAASAAQAKEMRVKVFAHPLADRVVLVVIRIVGRLQGIGIAINAADIFGRTGVLAGSEIGGNGIFLGVFFFAGGDVGQGDAMIPGVAQVVDEDEAVSFFFQQVPQGN